MTATIFPNGAQQRMGLPSAVGAVLFGVLLAVQSSAFVLYGEVKMNGPHECLYALNDDKVLVERKLAGQRRSLRANGAAPRPSPVPTPAYFVGSPHGQNMFARWRRGDALDTTWTRPVRDALGLRMVPQVVHHDQHPTFWNMTVWPVNRMTGKRSDLRGATKPYAGGAYLGRYNPAAQHAVWAAVGSAAFEYRPAVAAPSVQQQQQQERQLAQTTGDDPVTNGNGHGAPCKARMHLVLSHRCERPLLHWCGAKATATVLRCDRWPCVNPARSTGTFLVLIPAHQHTQKEAEKPPVKLLPMLPTTQHGSYESSDHLAATPRRLGPHAPRPL